MTTATALRQLPLGPRIRRAREMKGISQERLATIIGTSRRHMIRIEKGQHRPGPKLRNLIAEAVEQPEALFSEEDEDESSMSFGDAMQAMLDRAVAKAVADLRPQEASA